MESALPLYLSPSLFNDMTVWFIKYHISHVKSCTQGVNWLSLIKHICWFYQISILLRSYMKFYFFYNQNGEWNVALNYFYESRWIKLIYNKIQSHKRRDGLVTKRHNWKALYVQHTPLPRSKLKMKAGTTFEKIEIWNLGK